MTDNTAFVQSLYAAFGRGDVPFILAGLDEAADWVSGAAHPSIPWSGPRKGHAGAMEFFQSLGGNLDFKVFDPRHFAAEGDFVFVQGRTVAKVKSTGRKFDSEWTHVFTIANGKVKRFQEFYDTLAIAAALPA